MAIVTDAPFEGINFGDLPEAVNALLQEGVLAHRSDKARADALFREALASDPGALPTYLCLYKIHTYQGRLAEARAIARAGLIEAARQAGWPDDWRHWPVPIGVPDGAAGFALYTLKALAFIALRDDRLPDAAEKLDVLRRLDPTGAVGWPVIAALAEGVAA
jgi:tetratricopeptide (TPR) repeat protein